MRRQRFNLWPVLIASVLAACNTGPEFAVVRGQIDPDGSLGIGPALIIRPSPAAPRQFVATVITFTGDSCLRKGFMEATVEGLLVVLEPFDLVDVNALGCTRELFTFEHITGFNVSDAGTATVRLIGRYVLPDGSDSIVTIEEALRVFD